MACFIFFVVEFCEPSQLLKCEQYYLDRLFSLPTNFRYNLARVAEASFTGLRHTQETRQLMQESQSGAKNHMYGKKHSEESRQLISVAKLGENNPMFGKVGPRLGVPAYNAITISVYSTSGSLIQTFDSQAAAAKWLNCSRSTVQNYLRTGKCFKGLYYIRVTVI